MLRLTSCILLLVVLGARAQSPQDLCAGCVMVNGAGYNKHEDCKKYVQCHFDGNGVLVGEVRNCPFATYWDMNFLTCLPVEDAQCVNDACAGKPDKTVYAAETNCLGYWQCLGGKSQPMCCPYNHTYDADLGCVEDKFNMCNDSCFNIFGESALSFVTCDKKAVQGKPDKYKQEIAGWGSLELPCAPGTLFMEDRCACLQFSEEVAQKPVCKAEIHLPFTSDHRDQSGKGHYITNENVEVINGVAKFNGVNSRLVIPRFTNLEHSSTIVIKAKFSSDHSELAGNAHALVSNSDCGNLPSILISEDSSNMFFGVGTNVARFAYTYVPQRPVNASLPKSEKEVEYRFENSLLTGSNGVDKSSIDAPGYLRNVRCAIQIGHAENLQPFKGEIDELTIYLCTP